MKRSDVELSDTVYSTVLKVLGNKGDYPAAKRQGESCIYIYNIYIVFLYIIYIV